MSVFGYVFISVRYYITGVCLITLTLISVRYYITGVCLVTLTLITVIYCITGVCVCLRVCACVCGYTNSYCL